MSVVPRTTALARPLPAAAAAAAAVALLGDLAVGLAAPAATSDHSQGAGRVSEALVGLAFVLGAVALAALVPHLGRWGRALWWLAVAGLAAMGVTMLAVVVTGTEPPSVLVTAETLATFVGMVAAGVMGARRGVWPWPVGAGLALFLPLMFLAPLNALFMTAVWLGVAACAGRRGPARANAAPATA